MRRRVSQIGIGARTQVSRTAIYGLPLAGMDRGQIVEAVFGFGSTESVEDLAAGGVPVCLVGEQVAGVDAAMGANQVIRDGTLVEQFDEELTGDTEPMGGFDGGELGVFLDDRHGLAFGEVVDEFAEELLECSWEAAGLAVAADDLGLTALDAGV